MMKANYRIAALAAAASLLWAAPVCAGTWVQPQGPESPVWMYEEDGGYAAGWREIDGQWYYFDQDQIMATGWVRALEDGLWYRLDEETGAWIRRPKLDEDAVRRLLENAVTKSGHYQEENETEIRIAWKNGHIIYADLVELTGPNSYTTHNSYQVDTRSGAVDANIGKDFNLYD